MDTSFLAVRNEFAEQALEAFAQNWGISVGTALLILVTLMVWELVWKLIALWKSSRNGSVVWFIVLALVNTLGILPILYIFIFSKWGKKKESTSVRTLKKSTKRKR